ncbi:MAG: 4-hydroxy-tetrahydrodipicolinate reductase [Verrucomicrobia bacterium]|nr:MAG: 4-hydroxy-tetrahydrodipicolinate reductase [Verrucomicrobiota bacterium]
MNPTRLIIIGAKGRMGQTLLACAERKPGLQVVGQIDLGDDLLPLIKEADAVIDFSFHDATAQFAFACAEHKKALIIGTTGHTEAEKSQISYLQSQIAIVWASNYSTGVIEMHHRMKKDAPSGTAATLAEILAGIRGQQLGKVIRHGRQGLTGERTATEIGMHSLRGGDVVGDHTVIFAASGERLELTHKASSREAFASGALRAAQWVVKQKPGLYDMQDVLGLK